MAFVDVCLLQLVEAGHRRGAGQLLNAMHTHDLKQVEAVEGVVLEILDRLLNRFANLNESAKCITKSKAPAKQPI
jgi:hypothetical protein